MSENANGTVATVNPADPSTWTPEFMQQLAAKAAADQARKDAAKIKRERANDRPFLPGSTTERMNAQQAWFTVFGDMLRNWQVTYAGDDASFVRRITETIIPAVTVLGNTDSLTMSTSLDGSRHTLASFKVPTVVQPAETVPLPGKKS